MKILSYKDSNFKTEIARLSRRATPAEGLETTVAQIVEKVRASGDRALVEFAQKFDRVKLSATSLAVKPAERAQSEKSVSKAVRLALETAHANIMAFAMKGLRKDWKMKNAQGAEVGERYQPFQRVGLYVPGGAAPLVSTVLMTATLARAAGCPEVVVCTPCGPDGKINPAMLYAMKLAGVTEIFRVGGAQAIAAMAFGTASIRPVDKIFGPGNKYVVEAKRQVFGTVAIDLLPGPSEILTLADDSANPRFIAADILAQAEHGHDGEVVFVTPSARLLKSVQQEILAQLATLPRSAIASEILDRGCWLVQVASMKAGVELANSYAPEHLSLIAQNEAEIIPQLKTAGAIFCGNFSPVAAGDFLAGPSHTLPTGGAGKSFAGLTVDQFQRRTSVVKLSRQALAKSVPIISQFAEMEGLRAHGRSAEIRLE